MSSEEYTQAQKLANSWSSVGTPLEEIAENVIRWRSENKALKAENAVLLEGCKRAAENCPVCDGDGIIAIEDHGVEWDEPCSFCFEFRAAIEKGKQ